MSVRSVYLPAPSIQNDRIHITGEEHHHLLVARTESGEALEVFDGNGTVWSGVVESAGKREIVARLTNSWTVAKEPLDLILGIAMIRIAAFELALEKAVEVGVTRIVPFTAARSNVLPGNRHDRWMRILTEAVKQSKRYFVPALDAPKSFDEVLSIPSTSRIMFTEHGGGPLKEALAAAPVLYLVGPEGGWTDAEIASAKARGFQPVTLGAAILKAETAAIVGGALIRYECSGNHPVNRLK
jgi:16S rRNA (uracil1498-N3)-methyltransferase